MSNSALASMDAAIHAACAGAGLADAGLYLATDTPLPVPCRVYVNRAMQQMGDFGQSTGPRVLVEILRADVPDPVQGASITIAGETFVLESKEAGSDESMSRWVVGNAQ